MTQNESLRKELDRVNHLMDVYVEIVNNIINSVDVEESRYTEGFINGYKSSLKVFNEVLERDEDNG